jgi:Spy/CpxP family protein refolding chaperone
MEDEMKRKTVLFGLLGGGALVALLAARPIAAAIEGRGGWHGMHRMCGGHRGLHSMSPGAAKEHLGVATKWALRDIDASEEQQERVSAIAAGAVDDLFRLRERHQANREAFHAQLKGAAIDRAALEQVRQSEMALADEASKRLVQALADVGDVLTPEQRQALMERFHGKEDED